jgi:hypothetical protein
MSNLHQLFPPNMEKTTDLVDKVLENGGGGPHDPTMESRVARLEEDVRAIKGVLERFEPLLARIDERTKVSATTADVSELKGRLSNMPTIWGLVSVNAFTVLGVMGGAIALLKAVGALK